MVRSKFPGKPSKIVNRKVVKSSKYSVLHDNESSKAAESISYGLAVFNETFGDHEQVLTAFHGFSPHEVDKARETANKQQEKVDLEYETNGLIFPPDDAFPVKIDSPTPQMLSMIEANLTLMGPVGSHTTRAQCHSFNFENTLVEFSKANSPSKFFSPLRGNFKKHVANRLLQKAKKANLDVCTSNRLLLNSQFDKNGPVNANGLSRKFVLPSRSVHSSRVIKPNKRFLDSDDTEKDLPSPPTSGQLSHTRIIELKKPRLILDGENDFLPPKSDEGKSCPSDGLFSTFDDSTPSASANGDSKEHVKLGELNVFGAPTTRPKRRSSQCSADGSPKKNESTFPPNSVKASKPAQSSGPQSPSKSKLILRESKLNVSTATEKLQEGVFSKKTKKGLTVKVLKSPGTPVECGVCGAMRFHSSTKQASKFGIICCDACRKFIAKMILRARSSDNSVPCEKGQGNCAVSSSSQTSESFACKVNRCWACWLLLCIQRLVNMTENIRDSLIRMLPANMQGMTVVFPTATNVSQPPRSRSRRRKGHAIQGTHELSLSSIPAKHSPKSSNGLGTPISARKLPAPSSSKRVSQTPIARIKRKAALVSLANNLRRARDKTPVTPPGTLRKKSASGETIEKPSKIKKSSLSKKSDLHLKNADKSLRKGGNKTLEKNKEGMMRQKLSLKGPRVKHVCRSASIVLGQPLAMFPTIRSSDNNITVHGKKRLSSASCDTQDEVQETLRSKMGCDNKEARCKEDVQKIPILTVKIEEDKDLEVKSVSAPPVSVSFSVPADPDLKGVSKSVSESYISAPGRRISRPVNPSNQNKMFQRGQRRTLQDLGVINSQLNAGPELLSLDFWESYDPDEVCNTGFGLIGFDPFHIKPVCFLCGSAGKKRLIHCASCCEPYHQFCVEMGILGGPAPLPSSQQSNEDEWRVDWVCPRCTVCHGCGLNTSQQLTSCQRCHHSYHLQCLGTTALRKSAGDRLWICSSCLRCKSCNSADVTKFVGNLPFCKVCFKLRQKGNFCPLCQGCYADDDYLSKMMECAECKSWVHAKCEGLSDEKYQVLSYLPESVEFICRLCCVFPPAPWWVAVESELQAGYNNIIKAITKNRKACAMLKWSPQKTCVCQQRSELSSAVMASPSVSLGKRKLSFIVKSQGHVKDDVLIATSPSKSIHGSLECRDNPESSDKELVSSVFEFDDNIDGSENLPITRYIHAKDKNKRECDPNDYSDIQLECANDPLEKPEKGVHLSPNAGSQSDSGVGSTDDELKTCSAAEEEDIDEVRSTLEQANQCMCTVHSSRHPLPSLLSVKKKVLSSEYTSIIEFHRDMDQLISEADSHEVKELYHQTLQEVFPWFDPKYDRVSRNSFPLSPCKPHHGSLLHYQSHGKSPEKSNSMFSSSLQILERLLPKDSKNFDDFYFYSGINLIDTRTCSFCKLTGDSDAYAEGRLLYCGQNEWVHVNCALWSAEVFEEIDGALQNVNNALSRGRMIRCSECGKKGASVGCCAKKCEETLHFPCARKAGFVFMEDKNVYCPSHVINAPGKPLTKVSDFDIYRPVFVELDRRRKKCVESKHVRLMIGSLLVENLGNIVPDMSDQGSSIVPTQFSCTRLFWSSKEPWRIVRYTIRTTVRVPAIESVGDLGHHVTVDHSKESSEDVPKFSSSICLSDDGVKSCRTSLISLKSVPCKIESKETDEKLTLSQKSEDVKIVEAVINHLLDSVSSREADEEVSDAQNSADLLPPELKDAIFDDLPHDLLDGISMQDIFQDKFLNFEELGKDEPQEDTATTVSVKYESTSEKPRKLRNFRAARELKRSKSDVLPCNSSQTDTRLHQRSCSLAWSCKLGTNISCCKTPRVSTSEISIDRTKLIQELRLSVKPASSVDLRYCLQVPGDKGKENKSLSWPRIMQVDGISDAVLSGSDEGSDVDQWDKAPYVTSRGESGQPFMKFPSNFAKDSELLRNRIACLKTVTSVNLLDSGIVCENFESINQRNGILKHKKLHKKTSNARKCMSGSIRKFQIPQIDGTNDLSSDSEHDGVPGKQFQEQAEEKPVRCNRCGCTYRTEESYARHLPGCSGDYSLTTSESEAEISEDEAVGCSNSVSAPSPDSAISVSSGSVLAAPPISPSGICAASTCTSSSVVVVRNSASSASSLPQEGSQYVSVVTNTKPIASERTLMASNSMGGNVKATVTRVQKISSSGKSKATKISAQQQTVKLVLEGNQSVLHQQMFEQNSHQQITHHPVQHSLHPSLPQHSQQTSQMIAMLDYQQSQQSGPTVLVQSVPSSSMVPAYLEAFQQHTGQNLQYLTTVDTNGGYGKTQYLAAVPSTVVPGAFQLQAISDSQLCLEPSAVGISTLSGIQLAPAQITQAQPQVLGTLLQSPLSCGVVAAAEPVYETIQMYPDQSGGLLLASQPMLTCMETVVSNTYMSMSSSQFVSSSVPGMLQGSSTFSTTTTQVFQASKVDPPVLDVPTQYVVVNTHPSLPDASVGNLEVMSIAQPRIQEQTSMQSQARMQLPSINLPVPLTVTAPLPPQTLPPVIPTSVVNPTPRIQAQRTYSKPNKLTKDSVTNVLKSSVPRVTCKAVKETVKAAASQAIPKCIKVPILSPVASSNCSNEEVLIKTDSLDLMSKKCAPQPTTQKMTNLLSSPVPSVPSSELIFANVAPAQSITLPDPVKLNPPVAASSNPSKVVPVSAAPSKRPPVTFSYRSHVAEKGNKQNLTTAMLPKTVLVQPKAKSDINIIYPEIPTPKQAKVSVKISSGLPAVTVSPSVSKCSSSTTVSQVLRNNSSISSSALSSDTVSFKVIADVTQPTTQSFINTENSLKVDVTKTSASPNAPLPPTIGSPSEHDLEMVNMPKLQGLSSASYAVTAITSEVSQPSSFVNDVPTGVPPSQDRICIADSIDQANTADVPSSSTANSTASMNSLTLVTTTKTLNTNVMGMKPLKEISQANLNSELKPALPKTQDKVASDIPPTVLKSTSQNVDTSKRNDLFRPQVDIPMLFENRDNSPASLKLLFQKQAHNGCYKVSSSPGKKDGELIAVKLADISIISNGVKDKIKGGKDESENVEPVEKVPKKGLQNSCAPEIIYEIHCQDGFAYSSTSISDAWQKVFGAVQEARANHKMPPLLHNPFNSAESAHNVMGLSNNSLKYLIEQLPGVGDCTKYRPIYHKSRLPDPGLHFKREDQDFVWKESQSGCARTEPYLSAKKYDMFSWLDSRHRCPPKLLDNNDIDSLTGSRRATSSSLPMAMRFRHLRETSKTSVAVFRSDIHGRGLFCLRDIEAGEMVIEYAGEVIRNTLTDNREKYYQSKGIGCYMFKVDDNFTVDATQKGNAARFINHSCEPNCYSRVVDILGKKHIIIFAFRRIPQGEELTYDYKFPIEDEKIHCHCLARRCRKYLN